MTWSVSVMAAAAAAAVCVSGGGDYDAMFREFKATYAREYESAAEERTRYEYFVANMDRAAALNRANPLARFGVNVFADMSEDELRRMRGAVRERQRRVEGDGGAVGAAASGVAQKDWRTAGAVTPIKDQGRKCGSCWSFSTTGNIEGHWAIAGQPLTSLSEQELVSCDTIDFGCQGGLPIQAMAWLLTATGSTIGTEASYPYVSGNGTVPKCALGNRTVTAGARIRGLMEVGQSELVMAEFVGTKGPLSIGVDAQVWSLYKSGVMTVCPSNKIDHDVLIVGFDTTAQPPYWIVKNSWGAEWGEHGYIRIEMWKDLCGITARPSSAMVDTSA